MAVRGLLYYKDGHYEAHCRVKYGLGVGDGERHYHVGRETYFKHVV